MSALISALGSRKVLLILDNCEHQLPICAEIVERLVRSCARVHVLATSREPIRLAGEIVWPVPPLSTPENADCDVETLAQSASVRLFLERAQATSPDFTLTTSNASAIGEICRKLDGLPLALELAAPRLQVLTLEELSSRLNDGLQLLTVGPPGSPTRHQRLEATIGWSYHLLAPSDQAPSAGRTGRTIGQLAGPRGTHARSCGKSWNRSGSGAKDARNAHQVEGPLRALT